MKTVFEAKKELSRIYRNEDGLVGFGIGRSGNRDTIRIYVSDSRLPLVKKLCESGEFEGFPLEIQPVGLVEALPVKSF